MKRQIFTYTLAAFCAAAILSCNKEATNDSIGSDTEYTVLLTASIDASTKAVSIDESKVVSTWEVGDSVMLVRNSDAAIISKLNVISVSGNKAQLSGKVRGSYTVDTEMSLYYGGTDFDYSGQNGTDTAAVARAYLKAETQIDSLNGKTLYLHSTTMEHQQSYMRLSFYMGDEPVMVDSVVIKTGGETIVKKFDLGDTDTTYFDYDNGERFAVKSDLTEGQSVYCFALNDTNINSDGYELEISTVGDTVVYTGTVVAPAARGNYFADSKVILRRLSPVITAPTVYSHIYYDGLPHNLITPAVVRRGATAYYGVSTNPEAVPTEWDSLVPREVNEGSYTVWYKVLGGRNFENILPTKLGTAVIRAVDYTTIVLPTAINSTYNAGGQYLLNTDGEVIVPGSAPLSHDYLQYYVILKNGDTIPEAPTGEETVGWSFSIPERIDAGDYYIWCRYRDNTSSNLPALAGPVIAKIGKRSLTLTAADQSVTYGGHITTSISQVVVGGMGLAAGQTLDSVKFSPDSSMGITSEWIASTGGPIALSDAVIKSGSVTVTYNYDITYVNGHVTISN